MSHVFEYVRKEGPIVAYEVELVCSEFDSEFTSDELIPIRAKGTPYGCFYANKVVNSEGMYVINVGWSLCNKKDEFSKREARKIACARASMNVGETMYIPHSIEKQFKKFCERVKSYYHLNNFTHRYATKKESMINV